MEPFRAVSPQAHPLFLITYGPRLDWPGLCIRGIKEEQEVATCRIQSLFSSDTSYAVSRRQTSAASLCGTS